MFIRIVKMTFQEDKVNDFLANFHGHKHLIRAVHGCTKLELYQDKNNSSIFFTYSFWDSEHDLEVYRNSDLFNKVWSKTKILFDVKPEAWSVDTLETL